MADSFLVFFCKFLPMSSRDAKKQLGDHLPHGLPYSTAADAVGRFNMGQVCVCV